MTVNPVDECIEWLKNECDVSFLTSDKLKEIVSLILKWDMKNAEKRAKQTFDQEEKRKQEEATREDYKEEVDENGRKWYVKTHLSTQRSESRKLRNGDAIIFKGSLPGGEGIGEGFMIINSFDFDSDFSARAYYMVENCTMTDKNSGKEKKWTSTYSGGVPCYHKFSYATDDEIAKFFDDFKKRDYQDYIFYFKSSFTPDYISDRYHRFTTD